MSSPNPSITNNFSDTAVSFINALAGNIKGKTGLSALFDNLLNSIQSPTVLNKSNATAKDVQYPGSPSPTDNSQASSIPDSSAASATIGNVLAQLRSIVAVIKNNQPQQPDKLASQSSTSNGNGDTQNPAQQPSAAQAAAPSFSTQDQTAPNQAASGSDINNTADAATTTGGTTTPADPLAQLAAVLLELQKQLQMLQPTAATGASSATDPAPTTTADSSNTSNPPTGNPADSLDSLLAELRTLLKSVNSETGLAQTDIATNTPATTAQRSLGDATTDNATAKLPLLASLQNQGTSNSTPQTQNPSTDNSTVVSNPGTAPGFTTGLPAAPAPTTDHSTSDAQDSYKDALKQIQDILNFVNGSNTTGTIPTTGSASSAAAVDNAFLGKIQDNNSGSQTAPTSNNFSLVGLNQFGGDTPKSSSLYNLSSQLSATRTQLGSTGLPSTVEQVLVQLSKGIKTGNDQISIQLRPADLGTVNVKLDLSDSGRVSGTVMASNPDTLSALQKDSRSLERALQDIGFQMDSGGLQFSLSGDPNQGAFGQLADGQLGNSSDNTGFLNETSGSVPDQTAALSSSWIVTSEHVNIQV